MSTAEERLAAASERRKSAMTDRQAALAAAVQTHVATGGPILADDVTDTAVTFLRFLETGEANEVR